RQTRKHTRELVHVEVVELKRKTLVLPCVFLVKAPQLRRVDLDAAPAVLQLLEGVLDLRELLAVPRVLDLVEPVVEVELATPKRLAVLAMRVEDHDRRVELRDQSLDDSPDGVALPRAGHRQHRE